MQKTLNSQCLIGGVVYLVLRMDISKVTVGEYQWNIEEGSVDM